MEQQPNRAQQEKTAQFWRYWLWLLVVILIVVFWSGSYAPESHAISYTEFKQAVREDRVASVNFKGDTLTGTFRQEKREGEAEGAAARSFRTILPPVEDPGLLGLLEANGVRIAAESTGTGWLGQLLVVMLPWILILGLIFYAMRKMQQRVGSIGGGPGEGIFGFSKSKAKRYREGSTNVTFDLVAGLENAKTDLREIISYLKEPARFQAIGAKVPKGILLMGPPGTGKTLLAKAVAGEAGVPFYSISGSEFIEMFVGVGAARVRDMFESAKREAPSILFIDEIDSVGRARGTGLGGGHDEREQTLNQILNEMDGFEPHETVVVLAATNRPDVLDPALLRPGRFDRKVTLDLPRKDARQKILEVHTRKVPLAEDVDLAKVASRTVGFSGADLENLVNEAALLAGREQMTKVNMEMFNRARDKIILGAEREGLLSDEEKRVVAYHEAGHALLAWLLPEADPLDKVTIIPHGMALGATEQMPEEERQNLKRSYLLDRIAVMLGGRVSEKVVFGDITSGSESDLKQATQLVRRMVSQWGMSEKLGPVAFRRGEEHVFLGREMAQPRDYSETTARLIDDEVRQIIEAMEKRAEQALVANRDKLSALAERLIEAETVDGAEVQRLFA